MSTRMIIRLITAGAIAAVVAGGVLVFQNAPSAPAPASAKSIQSAFAAAIAHNPARIVHVAFTATETSATGAVARWSDDAWVGYPWGAALGFGLGGVGGFRQTVRHSGIIVQTGAFGRERYLGTDYYLYPGSELYDPSTNTIYRLSPVDDAIFCSNSHHHPCISFKAPYLQGCRNGPGGNVILGAPVAFRESTKSMDLRVKAAYLADNVYVGGPSPHPFFSGLQSFVPDLWSPCTATEVSIDVQRRLAMRVGRGRIDGRRVIEFKAADGSWTYYADARSDKPVRLVVRGATAGEYSTTPPTKREQATITFDVSTYESLPFSTNQQLLSLSGQHPAARLDTNRSDYYAAQARLFPRRRWG